VKNEEILTGMIWKGRIYSNCC